MCAPRPEDASLLLASRLFATSSPACTLVSWGLSPLSLGELLPLPPPFSRPLQDLREAFRIFDKDRSGFIEAREIISVTTTLGQVLSKDELEEFMAEADLDGDGRLDYEEFCRIMTKHD